MHLGVNLESNVERPFVVLFLTALSFSRPMSACDMGIEVLKQECETRDNEDAVGIGGICAIKK